MDEWVDGARQRGSEFAGKGLGAWLKWYSICIASAIP
jgi:hypothetical protein